MHQISVMHLGKWHLHPAYALAEAMALRTSKRACWVLAFRLDLLIPHNFIPREGHDKDVHTCFLNRITLKRSKSFKFFLRASFCSLFA